MAMDLGQLAIQTRDRSALKKAGFTTLDELLNNFPKRYEDRRQFDQLPSAATLHPVCLRGTIIDFRNRRFGGKRQFIEAVMVLTGQELSLGGRITLRWFNMPYVSRMVAVGMEVVVYGKPKESRGALVIDHPEFEVVSDDTIQGLHVDRVVPIYRSIQGITQHRLREVMWAACEVIEETRLRSFLHPAPSIDRVDSLRAMHFPQELSEIETARREFALEEFFLLQVNVLWKKSLFRSEEGMIQGQKTRLLSEFYNSLPFDLTNAQKRSVKEVINDLRSPHPMHRLLQGDVGSGKTFVAMCAMLLAVDSGNQAALMAPTQILAEQHYLTFKQWLDPLDIRVMLKTGSREEHSAMEMAGTPQIIIGTHALLYDGVQFEQLGLVVIDEQHRFGVEQRRQLIQQGHQKSPDVLVMTATPIPRTLTLTIYGDLDVSLLDEKPANRGQIVTAVRQKPKVTDVSTFLKTHLEQDRQAYLVYSLVEEGESIKAKSATVEYEKWGKRLSHFEVGLLHGKMKAEEKDAVMTQFRSQKLDVLVSTTVIEVGVDVPNATIMIIYDAERFGLAQLHQLRGRVGRGDQKSYCILITDSKDEAALEKLQILAKTDDGFLLADEDLKIRGPGEVLGTAQSGRSELKFVEFLTDTVLVREARHAAEVVFKDDPTLSKHQYLLPYLKEPSESLDAS